MANLPRCAVLVARGGSLSPAEIAASADELAEVVFLVDATEATADGGTLHQVAAALAPTAVADFGDFGACLAAVRQHRASVVTTFVDRYCGLAAQLDRGYQDPGITWGHKDTQREMLVQAGLSRTRAARVYNERSLRDFVRAVGLPVIVKPADGSGSRDLWLLEHDHDIDDLVRIAGPALAPGAGRAGMFAEEYITGDFPHAPHLGDYVSAEIFCFPRSPAPVRGFVTDRLVPMWPCRETGLMLPSMLPARWAEPVIAVAARAARALAPPRGTFHVEIKPKQPEPEVIEVNGRLGGFVARLAHYGAQADLGRLAIAAAIGRDHELTLGWRRCVLVLMFHAPTHARSVLTAPSRREVARLPGVLAVDSLLSAGTAVDWREGTSGAVVTLWLAADDHDALRCRLLTVAEFLVGRFVFAGDTGDKLRNESWLAQISGNN